MKKIFTKKKHDEENYHIESEVVFIVYGTELASACKTENREVQRAREKSFSDVWHPLKTHLFLSHSSLITNLSSLIYPLN